MAKSPKEKKKPRLKNDMGIKKQKPHQEEHVLNEGLTAYGDPYVITQEQWDREDLAIDRPYITPDICGEILQSSQFVTVDPTHPNRRRHSGVIEYSSGKLQGEYLTSVVLDVGEIPFYMTTAYVSSDGMTFQLNRGNIKIGKGVRGKDGKRKVEQYKVRAGN